MILERTTKGWIVYYKKDEKSRYLNTKQIKEIINYLSKYKFKNVYFYNKSNDLVIELSKEKVVIRNYEMIKYRPYINTLIDKINMSLLRRATKNIDRIFNNSNTKYKKITLKISLLFDSIILERESIVDYNKITIKFINNNLLNIHSTKQVKSKDVVIDVMEAII